MNSAQIGRNRQGCYRSRSPTAENQYLVPPPACTPVFLHESPGGPHFCIREREVPSLPPPWGPLPWTLLSPQSPGPVLFLSHWGGRLWMGLFVCSGCHNKVPQVRWLEQQKFLSRFWRLEVWDQDVSRVGFFWSLSLWLVDGRLLPEPSHHLPSVYVCVQISSSYEDTSHIGLGLTLMTHFKFITSLKTLSPNTVTFPGTKT